MKLFELIKKGDLEGLVVKRKDGKYKPSLTLWYKILNPTSTQKASRQEFFQRQ
jgi:ATP-dependent DNA ligase